MRMWNAAAHFQAPCSAFILSNGGVCGADPDRACLTVAARLDQVTYQDDRETTSQFLRFQSRKDVIVFSIHGYVGGKDPDHMAITSGPILPEDLTGLQPRLAYFDSCRLGISSAFLEHFRAMGTAYYVAPILRNEAGKSSTRTMIAFFEHLLAGESPEVALWLTRRELWQLYRECDRRKRWWRAFAFRVYRLN